MGRGWPGRAAVENGTLISRAEANTAGYPVRLVLPGWEGNTCVKWLHRLELSGQPFVTREETVRYSEPVPDGKIRQFSFVMGARSIITCPACPDSVERGRIEIRGVARSGQGKITRVEVSTDAGKSGDSFS